MDLNVGFVTAGCIGALLPELIRIGKGPVDGVFKTPAYWIQLVAQVLVGGVVAHFLGPKSPQEAFAFGYTAPQILTRIAAAPTLQPPVQPPVGGGGVKTTFNPRVWWSR